MMSEPAGELQDLLARLAQFYRANETSISVSQVSGCKGQLLESDVLALDRFFGLFLCSTEQNLTTGASCHSSPARPDSGPSVTAARRMSASAAKGRVQPHSPSAIPSSSCEPQQRLSEQQPIAEESSSSSTSPPCSHSDANATTPSPPTGATAPLHVATEDDDTFGTLGFSASTQLLLQSCKTDRGRFLRKIGEARTALPTGQGWEAAIATKQDNADLRDRMKIYNRFECYNIYKHVVEAGYHTGAHWIRDMRPALANKLCQDFPQRFPDQKAANKSLKWVDHGCRYHEWASQFGNGLTALGYLIALPLDVPHSEYTSRCTQERMHAAVRKLKSLGIDNLVTGLELSELGNHIAATLRDLTSRKRKDIPEAATEGTHKLPRLMACSNPPSPSHTLTAQLCQNPTPPESLPASREGTTNSTLDMDFSVDARTLSQSTGANACRSIAETYAVPYNGPFNLMDLDPSVYSGLLHSSDYNPALGPFDALCLDANFTEDLSQVEPPLTFDCNIGSPFHSGQ